MVVVGGVPCSVIFNPVLAQGLDDWQLDIVLALLKFAAG